MANDFRDTPLEPGGRLTELLCRGVASATVGVEEFIAPFSVPTYIPRFYYLFQKPIHLSKEDLDTEGRCQEVYNEVSPLFFR